MKTIKITRIPKEVTITVSEGRINLPSSLQYSIDLYWQTLIEKGSTFFRGDIFTIKQIQETSEELQVTLHKTDFAHFIYGKHHNLPEKYKCRVIVANGLLLTKDHYYILGEMNNKTANPGYVQLVAGGIDSQDIKNGQVDIFASLKRETKEEIGLDLNESSLVIKVEPRYIVYWGSVALVYLIQLALDSSEFQRRYEQFTKSLNHQGITPEFASIVLLPANDESVSKFLELDPRPKLDFLGPVLKYEMNSK